MKQPNWVENPHLGKGIGLWLTAAQDLSDYDLKQRLFLISDGRSFIRLSNRGLTSGGASLSWPENQQSAQNRWTRRVTQVIWFRFSGPRTSRLLAQAQVCPKYETKSEVACLATVVPPGRFELPPPPPEGGALSPELWGLNGASLRYQRESGAGRSIRLIRGTATDDTGRDPDERDRADDGSHRREHEHPHADAPPGDQQAGADEHESDIRSVGDAQPEKQSASGIHPPILRQQCNLRET